MTERVRIASVEQLVWAALAVANFSIACLVAYRPSLTGAREITIAVLPWVLLALVLAGLFRDGQRQGGQLAIINVVVAITFWFLLMLVDDNWSIFGFALYPLGFLAAGERWRMGLSLAALSSLAWAGGWIIQGSPVWTAVVPAGAFVVAAMIAFSIRGIEELNRDQAALITKLQRAQSDLAASERSKGMLEERARMASEIHDTLAQGFTSIILTSRAAKRVGDGTDALSSIEEIAQDNLDAARRLVEAAQPPELSSASLSDAIDRHLAAALPGEINSELRVVGEPRPLAGVVEVTMLRAAQEALLNVRNHAEARQVDVTLSYLQDAVVLDVRDDGVGFVPNTVHDRGSLTGGQGLDVLRQRAQTLDGELTIEANEAGGSTVSVLLPVSTQ